jgi:hypothetical protein
MIVQLDIKPASKARTVAVFTDVERPKSSPLTRGSEWLDRFVMDYRHRID